MLDKLCEYGPPQEVCGPVVCQKLVFGLSDGALWDIPVLYFVYMDDICLVCPRRFLKRAVRKLRRRDLVSLGGPAVAHTHTVCLT